MRNFRTAAVAAATAVTVAFGGVTVASAAENEQPSAIEKLSSGIENGSSATSIGKATEAWTEEDGKPVITADNQITGEDGFGNEQKEIKPAWFDLWKGGTIAASVVAVIGGLIAAYNQAVYTGILPQHILDPIFRR